MIAATVPTPKSEPASVVPVTPTATATNGAAAVDKTAATGSAPAAAPVEEKKRENAEARKSTANAREDSKVPKAGEKKKEADKKNKKDKKEDDARRLAEENVDEAQEIAELEATKTNEENKDAYKELYALFPQSVYTSYDKIKTFAREYVCPHFPFQFLSLSLMLVHPNVHFLALWHLI